MKTIPPPCPEPEIGPKFWRSLDQLAETPEFQQWTEREFPEGASELSDPVTRRSFMKIMSASFLLGGVGLSGCRRPVEYIYPFGRMPEGYVHGVPQFYATSMPSRDSAIPLLIKSHDGRPTKVEGNPAHPASSGGTDAFAQASILNLYDPDRASRFVRDGQAVSREEAFNFLAGLGGRHSGNGGQGLAFLMEQSSSPSRARLQSLIMEQMPQARWHVYEPVDLGIAGQVASSMGGSAVRPSYRLEAAAVIVSLDSDFLGTEPENWRNIRGFASGRRLETPEQAMSRLYAVEGVLSITGMNADHRLRVPSSAVERVAARLALAVLQLSGGQEAGEIIGALQRLGEGAPVNDQWVSECARDLLANRGQSLVLAGHRQPPSVQMIAQVLNSTLGNIGNTVVFQESFNPPAGTIYDLAEQLQGGAVETLIILGANPAYNAPAELNWPELQGRAKTVVRLGYYEDETFALSQWHFPLAHYLESWSDARTGDGTLAPVQPLIEPLFGGITDLEFLARLANLEEPGSYQVVRETFASIVGQEDWEGQWRKFLHDGFLEQSGAPEVQLEMNPGMIGSVLEEAEPAPLPDLENLEVVFCRDYKLDDGRYNNNGWLMELPDPVTKIVWDNPILLSRRTAAELNIRNSELIEVELGGRTVRGPAWIQPGFADYSLGMALGYGRERSGRIGGFNGAQVGFNAYRLRRGTEWHAVGARVRKTRGRYEIATTQDHHLLDGRPIIREANLEQFKQRPDFAKHMGLEAHAADAGPMFAHPYARFGEDPTAHRADRHQVIKSPFHQWGMSIDLNACIGCSACVIACQAENNVPIVGKDQVLKGREMHWLRIDRYYSSMPGDFNQAADDPQVNNQPMLCQHCDAAPCEPVCPVNATVQNEEGLNLMVYNRCVGTRYCSNNCPWKVRRFNFFDYNKRPLNKLYSMFGHKRPEDEFELSKLARNPDVTVRMRGVMEKCTFCVQRTEQAKIAQKIRAGATGDVQVRDGAFTTACAQACPADAIVFGNLLDPESRVARLKQQARDYTVLRYLDTRPRLTYLARIRNPNPNMPDYHKMPSSLREYEERRHDNPFKLHGPQAAAEKEPNHA